MLNPEDRRAIEGLFDRLAEAERRAPDRDRDAEELIRAEIARLPSAPYYMAQTIVVQQQGLEAAEARIKELEAQVAQRQRSPWDRAGGDDSYDPRQQRGGFGGGGFLGGAMQTALGVAGGVLLGSAIGSLFGAGHANAADAAADGQHDDAQDQGSDQDPGADAGNDGFDTGGDDFGGGDFDFGGDF
jgi:hypothetical protein